MNLKTYAYVRKEKLSRYLATKLSRNRSFTAMQLMLKTLETNQMLPKKLIALDVFGFIGTSITMDFQHLAEYIEMWEIEPYYAKEAKKNVPIAKVVCGDSVKAAQTGAFLRKDYNFIVIDGNSIQPFGDGSYESFGVFPYVLNHIADHAVIFVTIYSNLKKTFELYGQSIEEADQKWLQARRDFYQMENIIDGKGIDYLKNFEKIITDKNLELVHSQFINRNDYVGFGVFVVKKK